MLPFKNIIFIYPDYTQAGILSSLQLYLGRIFGSNPTSSYEEVFASIQLPFHRALISSTQHCP